MTQKSDKKNIGLGEDQFWKLRELKNMLRCMTYNELIDKIYEHYIKLGTAKLTLKAKTMDEVIVKLLELLHKSVTP